MNTERHGTSGVRQVEMPPFNLFTASQICDQIIWNNPRLNNKTLYIAEKATLFYYTRTRKYKV